MLLATYAAGSNTEEMDNAVSTNEAFKLFLIAKTKRDSQNIIIVILKNIIVLLVASCFQKMKASKYWMMPKMNRLRLDDIFT
ncbi:hypothetical protein S101_23605 [Salmonella enterica subsp. enterica serovar Tennessee]|nr:hypothetical protein S101_23605 [Salmonella enterica subsp. enterica serovar Tennessee]